MNFEFKPDSIWLYSLLMIDVYSNAGISTKKSWFVKPIPTISALSWLHTTFLLLFNERKKSDIVIKYIESIHDSFIEV